MVRLTLEQMLEQHVDLIAGLDHHNAEEVLRSIFPDEFNDDDDNDEGQPNTADEGGYSFGVVGDDLPVPPLMVESSDPAPVTAEEEPENDEMQLDQ